MSDRRTPPTPPTPRRAEGSSSSPFPHAPAPSKRGSSTRRTSKRNSSTRRSSLRSSSNQAPIDFEVPSYERTVSHARRSAHISQAVRPPYPARSWLAHLGVEANERLTASTAIVLLVLLAIEGFTILRVGSMLTLHVFVGALLVPPVLVKMSSTIWRFAKYYLGTPEYRHKGPPPVVLRVLGPFAIVVTIIVFATGFLLLLGPVSMRGRFLELHQASFIVWFAVMTIHVIGHLGDTARLSTKDWTKRTRQLVAGSNARRIVLLASLVVGVAFAFLIVSHVGPWQHGA